MPNFIVSDMGCHGNTKPISLTLESDSAAAGGLPPRGRSSSGTMMSPGGPPGGRWSGGEGVGEGPRGGPPGGREGGLGRAGLALPEGLTLPEGLRLPEGPSLPDGLTLSSRG